jgi:hypothetical protein
LVTPADLDHLAEAGWLRIGPDPAIAAWARAALPLARQVLEAANHPWRAGGTWFVGVDALPNGPDGGIGDVPFPWSALPLDPVPLHPAQLSTLRPGYPQPGPDESAAAFAFRRDRDAAHLDGLLPIGPEKRRMIREPHAFILGLPLNDCSPAASPLVVWEGSHRPMQKALAQRLHSFPAESWADVDVTETYQTARRRVFENHPRRELPARPGEATLLHRHCLHGVAPWNPRASAPPEGRIIAYFRPMLPSVAEWITNP